MTDKVVALADEIEARIAALPDLRNATVRDLRRAYSRDLKGAEAAFILALALELIARPGFPPRMIAYELVYHHRPARRSLDAEKVVALGAGMNSWYDVDTFGSYISGAAWREGHLPDEVVLGWTQSADRWWRRAALVSTTELNKKSRGGTGDTPRTLAVCRTLVADYDDMIVKALSWALRMLAPWDPDAVWAFLTEYEDVLAARIKREVRNKLETGRKNPKISDRPTSL